MKLVIKNSFKDALSKPCNEAVRINQSKPETLLNSKSEMNHPPVARITVEKMHKKAQPQLVSKIVDKISF